MAGRRGWRQRMSKTRIPSHLSKRFTSLSPAAAESIVQSLHQHYFSRRIWGEVTHSTEQWIAKQGHSLAGWRETAARCADSQDWLRHWRFHRRACGARREGHRDRYRRAQSACGRTALRGSRRTVRVGASEWRRGQAVSRTRAVRLRDLLCLPRTHDARRAHRGHARHLAGAARRRALVRDRNAQSIVVPRRSHFAAAVLQLAAG